MSSALDTLNRIASKSAFNTMPNTLVNISFPRVFDGDSGLGLYHTEYAEALADGLLNRKEFISKITPAFQRANTAWTVSMQQRFIENLLCGCATTIQLYDIKSPGPSQSACLILDGLQRLTAIAAFQSGEFSVFEDNIFYFDLVSGVGIFPRLRLNLAFFQFDSHLAACSFYIDMNRGITHSEKDLQSAYAFMQG